MFKKLYKYAFVVTSRLTRANRWWHSTGSCTIVFLQVLAHIKPSAFTSSNYISEHLDCLFHSIHFEMKALSLSFFSFHMVLLKVPFPVALEKSQVLQTFKPLRRNNSAVSGCTVRTEILCVRLVHTSSVTETWHLYHGKLFICPSPHRHSQHRPHRNEITTCNLEEITVVESFLQKITLTCFTVLCFSYTYIECGLLHIVKTTNIT